MISPATTDAVDLMTQAQRYRQGDLFAAGLATRQATLINGSYVNDGGPVGYPRTGHLYITGISDAITLDRIKWVLNTSITESYLDLENTSRQRVIRKSRYRLNFSGLPTQAQDTLRDTKELTITWEQAKVVVIRKSVSDKFDSNTDDETAGITDSNLSAGD